MPITKMHFNEMPWEFTYIPLKLAKSESTARHLLKWMHCTSMSVWLPAAWQEACGLRPAGLTSELPCGAPLSVIIVARVMKSSLLTNRWSFLKSLATALRTKKNCHAKMCQNLMFHRMKNLFSSLCSALEIQPCSPLFPAQTSNSLFWHRATGGRKTEAD